MVYSSYQELENVELKNDDIIKMKFNNVIFNYIIEKSNLYVGYYLGIENRICRLSESFNIINYYLFLKKYNCSTVAEYVIYSDNNENLKELCLELFKISEANG